MYKICRDYRRSIVPAPFLLMEGDLPAMVTFNVDLKSREVFLTTVNAAFGIPEEEDLKVFPFWPTLTVKGIDQIFEHPGVLEALQKVFDGDKDGEHYLLEVLSSEDFYAGLDALTPMEPRDYWPEGSEPTRQGEETLEEAAARLTKEALEEGVFLSELAVEFFIEDFENGEL